LLSWTFNKKLGFDSDELESRDRKTATLEPAVLVQSACAKGNATTGKIGIPDVTISKSNPFLIKWSNGDSASSPFGTLAANSYIYHATPRIRLSYVGIPINFANLSSVITGLEVDIIVKYTGVSNGVENFYANVYNRNTGITYEEYTTEDISAVDDGTFDTMFVSTVGIHTDNKLWDAGVSNDLTKIVGVGDSNTNGTGLTSAQTGSYSGLLQNYLSTENAVIKNNGVGGQTAAEYENTAGTAYTTYITPEFLNVTNKIVVFQMGLNDISGGATASETWDSINAVYDNFIADGIMIVACTIPYRLNDPSTVNDDIATVNAQIMSSAKPDYIVDLNAAIGVTASYFGDDVHLNDSGHIVWGALLEPVFSAITIPETYDVSYPLQNSCYDVSGNANHGTPTDITWGVQDSFHRNITKGFDRYLDDATSLVEIDVPYVSGVPVVSSVASYTKQSSHPAKEGWHNGAETKWVLGATTWNSTDSAWNVDAAVQVVDTEHILHSASTNYGIAQSYDDMVAEQGEYLFMDVSTANQYKNVLLYISKQTGTISIGIHKFVENRENLLTDLNGEYVYDLNNYPVWGDE